MTKTIDRQALGIALVPVLAAALLGSMFTFLGMDAYRTLHHPSFAPPEWVFPAVWSVLYLLMMPMRAFDITNITGLLRAGGDARTAAIIDLSPLWVVAVPLTALTGLVLDAPVFWVCLSIQAENLCKMPLGILRLRSRKWINDVTIRGGGQP